LLKRIRNDKFVSCAKLGFGESWQMPAFFWYKPDKIYWKSDGKSVVTSGILKMAFTLLFDFHFNIVSLRGSINHAG